MNIIEKMVLLGKITKALTEVFSVDRNGVYISTQDFCNVFGTDNSNFEIENWGGEDNMYYCTKAIHVDGVRIYTIFKKGTTGYCVAPRTEKVEFEAAAAKLATALEVG